MITKSRFNLSVLCVFALVAPTSYSLILNSFFLSDDFVQIGRVLEGDYSVVWGREHGGFFRPLFVLSLLIDARVWQTEQFGFHLTNVLLHGLNSFLVFTLTLSLMRNVLETPDARWRERAAGLAAGLIFALHPSHTEAVTWISGRADLLAAFFGLVCLRYYIAYLDERRASHLVASLVAFALALLAKESAICLLLVVFVVAVFRRDENDVRWRQKLTLTTVLFILLTLIYVVVRAGFLGAIVGGYGSSQHLNFSFDTLRDGILQFSIRSLLPPLPHALAPILTKPLKSPIFIGFALACVALLACAIIFRHKRVVRDVRRQQNRTLLLLLTLFLCSLAPVIQMGVNLFDTGNERFVYLPSAFASIGLSYITVSIIRHTKLWILVIASVLVFYSFALHRSNQTWREAAHISQRIVSELAQLSTSEHALVLNAPDSFRSVHLFRNGLQEAMRLFQPSNAASPEVRIIALFELESMNDELQVERGGSDVYSLRLQTDRATFVRVNALLQCAEILSQSQNHLRFRLHDCPSSTELFVFGSGRIRKLPLPE